MVSVLDRKVLRDLWHLRGQMAAVAVIVACGVATVVTLRTAYDSLRISQTLYYRDYRFADVFAPLSRAPEALARRVAAISGVSQVQTRVVVHVTLAVPGLAEPAIGRLVSVPDHRRPSLNDLHLRAGRYVEPGRRDETIVSEAFATANRLAVGDTLGAVINGRWQTLRIVGIALSPEYVYQLGPGWLFPDDHRFGVLWMGREALAAAFDLRDAFNDVVLSLGPGADEREVIARVDRLLDRYGGLGAYGRDDQVSHRFLSDELDQLRVSGTITPAIFLGVAAFLLHIVLARLIATQRQQIGVLKAFGCGNLMVGWHYAKLVLAIVVLGAVAGITLGLWLGGQLTALYGDFYRFPVLRYAVGPGAVVLAVGVSVSAALLGTLGAVRRAVVLPPAEAMRPEPPPRFRRGLVERTGLHRLFSPVGRMVLRNIERRPARALLTSIGIGFAFAVIIVGRYSLDAVRQMADFQFTVRERQDATVTFSQPRPARVRHELAQLPGVLRAEPFRAVSVRLVAGHRIRRSAIQGLEPDGELRRVVDWHLRRIALPLDGLLLTDKLAEILHVRPGDRVRVEVLEGARPVRDVTVTALVEEPLGTSAYMDAAALHRLLREGGTVSGAFLAVDPADAPALYAALKRIPAMAAVTVREASLQSFEETLARSHGVSTAFLVGFASLIAFGMVYNTARIALSERARELASTRVLGFSRTETARMLLDEQGALLLLAVPLGFALGYGGAALLSLAFDTELFRIPFVMKAGTYVYATAVVGAAALISAWIVRRRIDRLDLVAVLKTGD
jgi:putative ABC transport system permease protein